jgi:hypothetical protein
MNITLNTLTAPIMELATQAEAWGSHHGFSCIRKAPALLPRRRLAVCSPFVLFACAYVTLDRLPSSAGSVLRGGVGFVARSEISQVTDQVF